MWKIRQQDYGKIAKWCPVPADEIKPADFERCFLQSTFTLSEGVVKKNLIYNVLLSFTYCKNALYSNTVKFGLEDFNARFICYSIPSLLSLYRRAGSLFYLYFGLLGLCLILCLVIPVSVRRGFKLRR